MTMPYILKKAFTTDQLRPIKRMLPITRIADKDGAYFKSESILGGLVKMPKAINVPKPHKNPIYTLAHEFGHCLDLNSAHGKDNPIFTELRANRMAARYLLHTGSPISEVKDFLRKQKYNIGSYVADSDSNFINDIAGRTHIDIPPNIVRQYMNVGELATNNPKYQELAREMAKHIAKEHNINMKAISPFTEIKSPIDITVLGDKMKDYKQGERDLFARVMQRLGIKKKLRTPRVIYL